MSEDNYIITPPVSDLTNMESHTTNTNTPNNTNDRGLNPHSNTKSISKFDYNDMTYEEMQELMQHKLASLDTTATTTATAASSNVLSDEIVYICGFDDLRIVDCIIQLVCRGRYMCIYMCIYICIYQYVQYTHLLSIHYTTVHIHYTLYTYTIYTIYNIHIYHIPYTHIYNTHYTLYNA